MIVEERNAVRDADYERYMIGVYYTMPRWKNMPSLQRFLNDVMPKKAAVPQTPEQMFAMVKHLHAEVKKGGDQHGRRS